MIDKKTSSFVQLIGMPGSGAHRMVFEFLTSKDHVAWIRREWALYAPALWALAGSKDIRILGIECTDPKKYRTLWQTLYETEHGELFNAWVLDELQLRHAEGRFLQTLLKLKKNLKIIVIDAVANTFCQERIHCSLQHDSYKLRWSKGYSHREIFYEFPFKEDLCLR